MDLTTFTFFVVGLVLLILGGELLVRGSSRLALAMGVSPLVIGLTVVAVGTGSPELAVCVQSAFSGEPEIALGNVVGSNICNVLLVLGISAMVGPLFVSRQLVRWDVPVMIGVSLTLLLFSIDGAIGRIDGLLLLAAIFAYTLFAIRKSRRENRHAPEFRAARAAGVSRSHTGLQIIFILSGLALLVVGARWLVQGAVQMAVAWGVGQLIIGLTIVAVGTSLPEITTSVIATIRGHRDIAIGNVVGSNIFNVLAVLGICGIVAPTGIPVPPAAIRFDMPVMIAVAGACLPLFFTGNVISRWEGALFFGYYVAYTTFLILSASRHEVLPVFSNIMMLFVIPLTAITLLILFLRAIRKDRQSQLPR